MRAVWLMGCRAQPQGGLAPAGRLLSGRRRDRRPRVCPKPCHPSALPGTPHCPCDDPRPPCVPALPPAAGKVVKLNTFCPWKEHLYGLEEELGCAGEVLYCLYEDEREKAWRIQAVGVAPGSFESRKALPTPWRGLRDDELRWAGGTAAGGSLRRCCAAARACC